jgi:E3 ubiquitin-protein ligase HECTD4
MPSGGDLVFPITVRLLGESVAGSSGSFREFLARMATELHSGAVPVMTECASATLGQNKGKFVIIPGDVDFLRARLFEFFGTLIGIAIRADVPMILDLLPSFWKSMVRFPGKFGAVLCFFSCETLMWTLTWLFGRNIIR